MQPVGLLGKMVDSNLVSPKDYQIYFSKFLIEAKQELKKQAIAEKNKSIKKAEEDKDDKNSLLDDGDDEKDSGNDDLELYATLLLPYEQTNVNVKALLQQMLRSNDKEVKYNTMLLLLRNNKAIPDSMTDYFATLDKYRYQLYKDLKKINKSDKFPARFNNHLDLGKSKLMEEKSYDRPDSVVYLDRLAADIKGNKGFVYFYKYKSKKDDLTWKLATVGLVPQDPTSFEFENTGKPDLANFYSPMNFRTSDYYRYDFTNFTDTRIKDDEPLTGQLKKTLKKLLYSKRKSAKEFYERESRGDDLSSHFDFGN